MEARAKLGRGDRIESLVAVRASGAGRWLNAKWLARTRGAEPVDADVFGREALTLLAARFGEPAGGWTHQSALVAVARLGGFLGANTTGCRAGKRSGAAGSG